jgi:hypothetical protein
MDSDVPKNRDFICGGAGGNDNDAMVVVMMIKFITLAV